MSEMWDKMENTSVGVVTVTTNISQADILTLVCGFHPSENNGSGYWMESIESIPVDGYVNDNTLAESKEFALGYVTFDIASYEEPDSPKRLTMDSLLNGLSLWAKKTGRSLNDFGNIDSLDADCILQYALFGEELYC